VGATAPPPRISGSIDFPIDDLDRIVIEELLPASSVPARHSAINAIRHLNRAWRARDSDPEMSVFRSITAEEESATAIFLALKRLGYLGADRINHRDHVAKNAITPFSMAVGAVLQPAIRAMKPELYIDRDLPNTPRLGIRFPTKVHGEPWFAAPTPPLKILMTQFSTRIVAPQTAPDFLGKVEEIATLEGSKSIMAFLRERANTRNRVLYASVDGWPGVHTPVDVTIGVFRRHTLRNLKFFLLVDEYPERQPFAQLLLDAFRKTLGHTPIDIAFA
jgi:hypothetical protein